MDPKMEKVLIGVHGSYAIILCCQRTSQTEP